MFKVSDKAAEVLHEALDANETDVPQLFRLTASDDGLDLQIGELESGDQIVSHDERQVLAVQPEVADALDGATLDAVETEDGRRLVLEGPGLN